MNGPSGTIVVAANDKEQVEQVDVDHLLECVAGGKARNAIIYTTYDTGLPTTVAAYAKAKGVEVTRTLWWQDD